jgi:hypothetical protein
VAALASDARKGTPFGVDERHITFGSETAKELHNARVLAAHLSFVPFPTRVTGRQLGRSSHAREGRSFSS